MPCRIKSKRVPAHVSFKDQVVYSFTDKDIVKQNPNYVTYRFPYSKNTFWLNFKYTCFNSSGYLIPSVRVELYIDTTGGDCEHILSYRYENYPNQWCHTKWPLPSIQTDDTCGIFFRVYLPQDIPSYQIKIDIQGFVNYYPSVENYLLVSEDNFNDVLFLNFDSLRDHKKEGGVILNALENDVLPTNRLLENEMVGIRICPL
jgi:hypothetical protein